MPVIKNTRDESREGRDGRIRFRRLTTWDVVKDGVLISEHRTKSEAIKALIKLEKHQ